ncbi:MAG: hypothetical protein HOP15_11550 [Planctomycetes bacterium]|nr:hypothetical protein [Planctomycetota bacterium]
MRPLVVLLLVLGSLAALFFALTTLGSGRQSDATRGVVVDPTPEKAKPTAVLVQPIAPADARATPAATDGTRQPVSPARDPAGPKLAFGAIHGKVMNEEGNPIAGARVNLFDVKPSTLGEDAYLLTGEDPPRPVSKSETDDKGTFRFEQLDPRKDWSLAVTHDLYEHWASEVEIPVPEGGVYPETILLKAGQSLSGFVYAVATKQPIEGALLVAENPFAVTLPKNKRSQTRLEAMTDGQGKYVFANVGISPNQNRMLTVSAPGYATQVHNNFAMVGTSKPSNRIKGNKQEPVRRIARTQDFELEPGHVIAGKVIGPDHGGMAGIEIEALNSAGAIGSTGESASGKNGEFLIEGLAQGIYTLRVTATNYDAAPLQRVETGNTNVVIELFELAVVTGRVVDADGRALTSFTVKARAANEVSNAYGAVLAHKAVRDSEGRFELTGVPEGSYVIEGLAEGYASCFSEPFTATQGLVASDIVVRMTRGGSLSGVVLDAYGNTPIAGAEVSTHENDFVDGNLWEIFGALDSAMTRTKAFTDEQGRFTMDVLTPGLYQVHVRARGFAPDFIGDVEVIEGQETELPARTLIKGATIDGIVYGRNASVECGATVQLNPQDVNATSGSRQTRSDGTGRFVIANVQPGTYILTATRPSGGMGNPFEALADMKQSEVTLSIEDGGLHEIELHLGPKRGN